MASEKAKKKIRSGNNCMNINSVKYMKDTLKVFYCNARSIRNKIEELRGIIAMEELDIIGITESWANADDLSDLFEISGYNLFRCDRLNKKGGGVLLYVRSDLNCIELNFQCETQGIESVWIKLTNLKNRHLVLGNVYRPPNCSIEQDVMLCNLIREACQNNEVIIMGDFNFPNIDWNNNVTLKG